MAEFRVSDLMAFFEVKSGEFMEFWKSLSEDEKAYYRQALLEQQS